jgi:hypothetical protein
LTKAEVPDLFQDFQPKLSRRLLPDLLAWFAVHEGPDAGMVPEQKTNGRNRAERDNRGQLRTGRDGHLNTTAANLAQEAALNSGTAFPEDRQFHFSIRSFRDRLRHLHQMTMQWGIRWRDMAQSPCNFRRVGEPRDGRRGQQTARRAQHGSTGKRFHACDLSLPRQARFRVIRRPPRASVAPEPNT